MLKKTLYTACKRTALVATMAFMIGATSLPILANGNSNAAPNEGVANTSFDSSANDNPLRDNAGVNVEGDSNPT